MNIHSLFRSISRRKNKTIRRARPRKPVQLTLERLEARDTPSYIVTTTADDGVGSLRWAIEKANVNPGFDEVDFNLGDGTAVQTIMPLTPLPALTDPAGVYINGYSAPGASRNTLAIGDNARLMIELNGSMAGAGADGLRLTAGSNKIEGLVINRFDRYGLFAATSASNVVDGNFIGTDPTGATDQGNGRDGVYLQSDAPFNLIGGSDLGARNVISGNIGGVTAFSRGNFIQGNYIGVTAAGNSALPNEGGVNYGAVNLFNQGNTIGGVTIAPGTGAGNVIAGNTGNGILMYNGTAFIPAPDPTLIEGNLIGLGADGTTPLGNRIYGIYLALDSINVTIGGTNVDARNVISDNGGFGIVLDGVSPSWRGASNATIQGNYIGTDKSGLFARGNLGQGIYDFGTTGLSVGGPTARPGTGAGNVIAGNTAVGVYLAGTGVTAATVEGNIIGLGADGATEVGGQQIGVLVNGSGNTIGGTAPGAGNVISGNSIEGVLLDLGTASGNVVAANYIGTDIGGTSARENGAGVQLQRGANNNKIGGSDPGAGNLISGNRVDGVLLIGAGTSFNVVAGDVIRHNGRSGLALLDGTYGNRIGGPADADRNVISGNGVFGVKINSPIDAVPFFATADNMIQRNLIGTDSSGRTADPNGIGVIIRGGQRNLFRGNVISGNVNDGVDILEPTSQGNVLHGNRIGTDRSGHALGNGREGVFISVDAHDNIVGGTALDTDATLGNEIAFNGRAGVAIGDSPLELGSTGNTIRFNSIHDNGLLGIDLGSDGVTLNDPGDPDPGPNRLQNFPDLLAVTLFGRTQVFGGITGQLGETMVVDFYANPTADPFGFGEGRMYLGTQYVVLDVSGNGTINFDAGVLAPGSFVSATATRKITGDTSEFSAAVSPVSFALVPLGDGTFELDIFGDSAANQIAVVDMGPSPGGLGDTLEVTLDKAHGTVENIGRLTVQSGPGDDEMSLAGVLIGLLNVQIDTGSGDDAVILSNMVVGPDQPTQVAGPNSRPLSIAVSLGTDDDLFSMHDNLFQSGLNLALSGGSGNDTVMFADNTVDSIQGVDPDPRASISFQAFLGDGNDAATLTDNTFLGAARVNVSAGIGNDLVSFLCNAYGRPARIDLRLGAGDDVATFMENTYKADASIGVDAGFGNDVVSLVCNAYGGPARIDLRLGAGDDVATFKENTYKADASIGVDAGLGNDIVSLVCDAYGGPAHTNVRLGAGDDVATFMENTYKADASIDVDAGFGNDLVSLLCNWYGGAAHVDVRLGAGDDTASFMMNTYNSDTSIRVDGDAGNDNISVVETLPAYFAGSLDIRLLGGAGDDNLTLKVDGNPKLLAASFLLIDGGAGFDHADAGPFVKVVRCEK